MNMEQNEPTKEDLVTAAFALGDMLSKVGDFYDVAEALAAGWAAGVGAEAGGVRSILSQLGALNELQSVSNEVMGWRVDDARAALVSWSDIGDVLEISKQAAQQRWGKKAE
jgi:hypothetical protein